jgi:hypothetical protein
MKIHPVAIAALAAAGTAAAIVVSGASGQSSSSAQQLIINQKISQAAVRRSNAALNYLQAVRTQANDTANGISPSNPIGVQSPTGAGWLGSEISTGTYYARVNSDGTLAGGSPGVTSSRNAALTYTVNFPVTVSACTYSATSTQNAEWPAAIPNPAAPTQVLVTMWGVTGGAGVAASAAPQVGSFHLIAYC